jgi:hypothetical protein
MMSVMTDNEIKIGTPPYRYSGLCAGGPIDGKKMEANVLTVNIPVQGESNHSEGQRGFVSCLRRRAPNTTCAATSPAQIRIAERRAVVMDLRRKGHDFRAIAQATGISVATAYRDVVEGMAEITREPARELLTLELERLDQLSSRCGSKSLMQSCTA